MSARIREALWKNEKGESQTPNGLRTLAAPATLNKGGSSGAEIGQATTPVKPGCSGHSAAVLTTPHFCGLCMRTDIPVPSPTSPPRNVIGVNTLPKHSFVVGPDRLRSIYRCRVPTPVPCFFLVRAGRGGDIPLPCFAYEKATDSAIYHCHVFAYERQTRVQYTTSMFRL